MTNERKEKVMKVIGTGLEIIGTAAIARVAAVIGGKIAIK